MQIQIESTQTCNTCDKVSPITAGVVHFINDEMNPIYCVFTCSQCDYEENEPCQECALRDCSCVGGKTLSCIECYETYTEGNSCESCNDSNRDDNANPNNHFTAPKMIPEI